MYDGVKDVMPCHADTNDGFMYVPLNLKDFDKARRESSSLTRNPGIDLDEVRARIKTGAGAVSRNLPTAWELKGCRWSGSNGANSLND